MDNENRNAIRATPGTHECEGETTLVYAVEGRPEVLRELVDALDLKVADHDLPRGARAGACRVWAASASATHADVAVMLRRASDASGVDLVFAVPAPEKSVDELRLAADNAHDYAEWVALRVRDGVSKRQALDDALALWRRASDEHRDAKLAEMKRKVRRP